MRFNPSTVEDLRSKFTAEYRAIPQLIGAGRGGGVSTCLDTRNTAWIGQEFHWETRIFSTWGWETGQKRGGSWRMADGFFNNPRPSLFQSFSWNQAIRKKSWTAVVRMVESLDRKPPLRWLFNYHACFVPPFFLEGKLRIFFFFFFLNFVPSSLPPSFPGIDTNLRWINRFAFTFFNRSLFFSFFRLRTRRKFSFCSSVLLPFF